MVNFEETEAEQEKLVETKTEEVWNVFQYSKGLLKGLQKQVNEINDEYLPVRIMAKTAMAKRLHNLCLSCRSVQKQYLIHLNSQKTCEEAFKNENEKCSSDEAGEGTGCNQSTMGVFVDGIDSCGGSNHTMDAEIVKIAKSIQEMSQLSWELADLVIEEGTILDRIDYHMEYLVHFMKPTVPCLIKAKQRSTLHCSIA